MRKLLWKAKETQFSVPLIHFPIVPPASVLLQLLCFLLFSVIKHGELKKQEMRGRGKNNYANTSAVDTEHYLYIYVHIWMCVYSQGREQRVELKLTPQMALWPFPCGIFTCNTSHWGQNGHLLLKNFASTIIGDNEKCRKWPDEDGHVQRRGV